MTRKLVPGSTLVIASHNQGKLREIAALLAPYAIKGVAAPDLGLAEPEETGATFAENAGAKALLAAQASGLPALGDDSGMAVEALDGAPGIHSARWGGPDRDWPLAMRKVTQALDSKGVAADQRRAAFISHLALAWPDGHVEHFEGRVEGKLTWPMRGEMGFGYDPIFLPEGGQRTFAELAPEEKDRISHRGRAFALLQAACLG